MHTAMYQFEDWQFHEYTDKQSSSEFSSQANMYKIVLVTYVTLCTKG